LLRRKFLFGTSYPLQSFKRAVDEFLGLPLRDETKQAILYDNAAKLLQLQGATKA
jgi:predicted TIM-barrel fold metal-dependent hydrolase